MLPDIGDLTPEQMDRVASDFAKYRAETRVSLDAVSRSLGDGFSAATLSKFVNHRDTMTNPERVARALNKYIDSQTRSREASRPDGFVETRTARNILTVVRTAVETKSMGIVVGPAGVGKTLSAKAAQAMFPGAIYLRITQAERRTTGMLKTLLMELKLPKLAATCEMQRRLIEHLTDTGRPLLIDEAHKLTQTSLDALRDLHDEAGLPVILFGTIDLKRQTDDTTVFFGQFSSRVIAHYDATDDLINPRGRRKPKPLFSVDEILRVFASEKLRLTDDGAECLAQLASLPGQGCLRLCAKIVDLALRIPKLRQDKGVTVLNAEAVLAICRQMHGDTFMKLREERAEQLYGSRRRATA